MQKNGNTIQVAMITLGCSKNLVDAECMTRILMDDSMTMVTDPQMANVIVINTCGFIESAKQEAIDKILQMSEFKAPKGKCDYIIVTGCLSQRYPDDIRKFLPEVDEVLGTSHYQDIAKAIRKLYGENNGPTEAYVSEPGSLVHMRSNRVISTTGYAWLKIAEGCSNRCAYCAIPMIRGEYISRPIEDVIMEAQSLSSCGYSEIILTAQDTTRYGLDLYGRRMLPTLLRKLSEIDGIQRIRIMYTYSDGVTEELIEEMRTNTKIAHYLDMPIQYAEDEVLQLMRRRDTVSSISAVINHLRDKIPDIILRTTVMVGFPGEKATHFDQMIKNITERKFDRLGCFIFSKEEDTPAYDMPHKVRKDIAKLRYDRVMEVQQAISLEKNVARMQTVVDVTIDSISEDGIFYVGRSFGEAPEVDPLVYVAATGNPLEIGKTYAVRFVDCSAYDLTGVN